MDLVVIYRQLKLRLIQWRLQPKNLGACPPPAKAMVMRSGVDPGIFQRGSGKSQ